MIAAKRRNGQGIMSKPGECAELATGDTVNPQPLKRLPQAGVVRRSGKEYHDIRNKDADLAEQYRQRRQISFDLLRSLRSMIYLQDIAPHQRQRVWPLAKSSLQPARSRPKWRPTIAY